MKVPGIKYKHREKDSNKAVLGKNGRGHRRQPQAALQGRFNNYLPSFLPRLGRAP